MKFESGKSDYIITEAREKSRKKGDGVEYVAFEYHLKSKKEESMGILLKHKISDPVWEMETSSHDYEVIDAHNLEFHIYIQAEKSVIVEFTYKVKHPH